MAEEVKLLGVNGSPFSCRVEIALKLKGVAYEFIQEDLANKSPLLLKSNPVHKKIPVLIHNGKPIAESLVILEYIDETWKSGPPILPQHPYDRALARFWAKFIDEQCFGSVRKALWSKGEEHEKAKEEALGHLKRLEDELEGKKFFGGDSVGFVDITANFVGFWLGIAQEAMGVELLTKEQFPRLFEWIDNYLSTSIIKENLPPRDHLLAFFKARAQAAK